MRRESSVISSQLSRAVENEPHIGVTVIDQREIWQCANQIVKQFGDDAPLEAAMRADAMFEKGDLDGQAVWKRIMAAVQELLRTTPGAGEGTH